MNDENLKPFGKLTESELREIRKKGGLASGRKRRALRFWKDLTRTIPT